MPFSEFFVSSKNTIANSLSTSLFAFLLKKSFTFTELIFSLSPYNLGIITPILGMFIIILCDIILISFIKDFVNNLDY